MDLEAVFATAGTNIGLQIWRVENYKLNPIEKKFYGTFYCGDCYLIMNTILEKADIDLHFWIGSDSTQDEYGAAAVIAAQMDQALDDVPKQYRETEGNESETMSSYFEATGGIKYKSGGVASGAHHVVSNADDNVRILRLKGIRNKIKAKEVKFEWASVTNDDVYVIEIGSDIYRWKGSKANIFEWLESNKVATSIRDNEQNGRGEIFILNEGDDWPEAVTQALGEAPSSFPAGISDKQAAAGSSAQPKLYKISTDTGTLEVTCVHSGPGKPARSIMETDDCYLLDDGANGTLYVWKGRTSELQEKRCAMKSALKFIDEKGYDARKTSIEVYPQNYESGVFKNHFDWSNI